MLSIFPCSQVGIPIVTGCKRSIQCSKRHTSKAGVEHGESNLGVILPMNYRFLHQTPVVSAPILPTNDAVVRIGGPSLQNVEQNLPELRQNLFGKNAS